MAKTWLKVASVMAALVAAAGGLALWMRYRTVSRLDIPKSVYESYVADLKTQGASLAADKPGASEYFCSVYSYVTDPSVSSLPGNGTVREYPARNCQEYYQATDAKVYSGAGTGADGVMAFAKNGDPFAVRAWNQVGEDGKNPSHAELFPREVGEVMLANHGRGLPAEPVEAAQAYFHVDELHETDPYFSLRPAISPAP